jgi:hypothetical protein
MYVNPALPPRQLRLEAADRLLGYAEGVPRQEPTLHEAALLEHRLLIARHPSKYYWFRTAAPNEVVNLEIYRETQLIFARIGRHPRDIHNTVLFVDRRNAQPPDRMFFIPWAR